MRDGRFLLVAALLLISGCGDNSTDPDPTPGPAAVDRVDVTTPASTVAAGDTLALAVALRDAAGNVLTGRTVEWSSDNAGVVRVDAAGKASGEAPGTATVTARSEGRTGQVTLTVTPARVVSLTLSRDTATVAAGATLQLEATARDRSGAALAGRAVTWASGAQGVAQVDASGRVSAVAPGTAIVTATSEGKTAQATITVVPVPIATLTLSPAAATVQVGASVALAVTARDAAGNELAGRQVLLVSSDAAVATLEGTSVRAVAPGIVTITASAEGKTAQATITVIPVPIATLAFEPDSAAIFVGGTAQFRLVARDAGGNELPGRAASVQNSNPAAVSLSASLLATGIAPGTAVLTAAAEGKTATAKVVVSPVPVATLAFEPDSAAIVVGGTVQLRLIARDAAGNELLGREATVQNSNPAALALTASLLGTGVAPGTAVLTATAEGKTATAKVVVSPAPVASVRISPDSARIERGGTVDLSAAAFDAQGNALTGRPVSWSSGNPSVATVSATGLVTGVGAGVTEVYATSEGRVDAARITVTIPADTEAPTLSALTITPGAVDVSFQAATVIVRATVADAGTGVSTVDGAIRSPSGVQSTGSHTSFMPVSGTRASGTFEIAFTIPASAQAGDWKLLLNVRDGLGNLLSLGPDQLQARGLPNTVAVTSGAADATAPVLTGLVIDPASVDVSSQSKEFVIRVTATDAGSGVQTVSGTFRSPSGTQSTGSQSAFAPVSGTRSDGVFEVRFSVRAFAEGGSWTPIIVLHDRLGNVRVYEAPQLQAAGLPSSVQVVSPNADVTAPTLHTVTITPSAVNVGSGAKTVTVRADVSDAGVGVAQIDGYFQSPSGAQRTGAMSGFTPVSGTRASGAFEVSWTIPAGAETGEWKLQLTVRDQVGNLISLSPEQLAARGFVNSVTVSN